MKLHNISRSSLAFRGRKCSVCKLVVKPGETIVAEGRQFQAHRFCLSKWLDDTYLEQSSDLKASFMTAPERQAQRTARAERKFNEYREGLLERYGAEVGEEDAPE